MAAVTLNLYDKFREGNFDGNAKNFETPGGNGIKCAIVTGAYTVDQNLHDFFDDIGANQVSGTGRGSTRPGGETKDLADEGLQATPIGG